MARKELDRLLRDDMLANRNLIRQNMTLKAWFEDCDDAHKRLEDKKFKEFVAQNDAQREARTKLAGKGLS